MIADRLLRACSAAPSSSGAGEAADSNGAAPAGPQHVLCWAADVAPPVLPAWDFGRVFFGMLRTPGMSVTEVGAGRAWGHEGVAASPMELWYDLLVALCVGQL